MRSGSWMLSRLASKILCQSFSLPYTRLAIFERLSPFTTTYVRDPSRDSGAVDELPLSTLPQSGMRITPPRRQYRRGTTAVAMRLWVGLGLNSGRATLLRCADRREKAPSPDAAPLERRARG